MSKTGEYTEDIDVDLEEPEEEYEGGGAGVLEVRNQKSRVR